MSRLYRRTAFGWQAPGSGTQSLRATFASGSSLFESDRAAREGNFGPVLGNTIIAIPSAGAVGDQYFSFQQRDAAGDPIGVDSASLYPALAGYTGNVVDLPAGILTGDDVATAYETAANSVYGSVSRTANAVTITDDITAASAFMPSSTSGGGGILGTRDTDGPNDFAQDNSNVCSFTTPAFGSTAYLVGIQVRIGGVYVDRPRVQLYTGGAVGAPVGSSLLYDFGQTPAGASLNSYTTMYATSLVQVPASTLMQVLLIGAAATTTEVNYQNAAGAGDYNTGGSGGLFQCTAAVGNNPAVAGADPFPAGGSQVSASFTFNVRILYRLTPFYANGYMVTQYGVHVPASDLGFTSSFSSNVMEGGSLPPQIEGLELDGIEMATVGDASMRMGAFQGAVVEDFDGATLLYDGGRGPAGPGLPDGWRGVSVPSSTRVPIDRTQPIWAAGRNDGTATIRFSNVAGPGSAGPDTNPMDWPQNTPGQQPEYETFVANTNFSINPDVAFESPFVAAVSDTLPGNVPGMRLSMRTQPIVLDVV